MPLGHKAPNGRLRCGREVRPKSPIPPLPPTAQIDADGSGTIEFDEFVKVIQMLHPLQATRRSAAEQAAAFDHLCLAVKKPSSPSKGGGDTRAGLADVVLLAYDDADRDEDADPDAEARLRLRSTVPRAAQRFAGAVVGNMRDSGFDDRDIVQVLQALFPKKRQEEDVTQATPQRRAISSTLRSALHSASHSASHSAPHRASHGTLRCASRSALPTREYIAHRRRCGVRGPCSAAATSCAPPRWRTRVRTRVRARVGVGLCDVMCDLVHCAACRVMCDALRGALHTSRRWRMTSRI